MTGQKASQAAGDDGALEQGVAWPSPRFKDNGNGTVTDRLTRLIWLKSADCLGAHAWTDALNAASTVNSGECGLTDGSLEGNWRLPNRKELRSLIDYSQFNHGMPSVHPFSDVQSYFYWSSSTSTGTPGLAWAVNVYDGDLVAHGKANT